MTDKVYADEPWVSVRWESEQQCVHTEWKAFANSQEFRGGLTKALEAIRENHAERYLSDARKVKVIVREDQDWSDQTWFPQAAAAGLKRFAMVVPESGLGKITLEEILDEVDIKGLKVCQFSSVSAARKWLAEI